MPLSFQAHQAPYHRYVKQLELPLWDKTCLFEAGVGKNINGNMFALVRERKRLMENGEENRERIRELEDQILEHMPIEKALDQYMEAQQEYDRCRVYLKNLRHEIKLLEGIRQEAEKERQQTASVPGDEKKQKGIERNRDVPERRL